MASHLAARCCVKCEPKRLAIRGPTRRDGASYRFLNFQRGSISKPLTLPHRRLNPPLCSNPKPFLFHSFRLDTRDIFFRAIVTS